MKRSFFLSLILVLGLGAFLVACAGSDDIASAGVGGGGSGAGLDLGGGGLGGGDGGCEGPLCEEVVDSENTNDLCRDGLDNDGDGAIDCGDTNCSNNTAVTICGAACTGAECDTTCRGDDCDDDVVRPVEPPAPRLEISTVGGDDQIVKIQSQLHGVAIPADQRKQFTVTGGSGQYLWTFEQASAEELEDYCGACRYATRSVRPDGILFAMVGASKHAANETMESVKIAGTPMDNLGKYVFKVKVTDTSTGQPTSGLFAEKVVRFHIADKITVDVYRNSAKGGWGNALESSASDVDLGFENEQHGEDYAHTITVDGGKNFTVARGQVIRLVARGASEESFKWCIMVSGRLVCEANTDLENDSIELKRNPPASFGNNELVNRNVRYLSAKRGFDSAGDDRINLIRVKDRSGNYVSLNFEALDFECRGDVELYHTEDGLRNPWKVYGNMGSTVHRIVEARGGSGNYEWSSYSRVINTVSWVRVVGRFIIEDYLFPGIENIVSDGLFKMDVKNSGTNGKKIEFTFDKPENITLGQYLEMVKAPRKFLALVTVSVKDNVCGSGRWKSRTFLYQLSDLDRDSRGIKENIRKNLYLDDTNDMEIKVNFSRGDHNAINETVDGSKMIVKLRQKETDGGSDEQYCGGGGTTEWWKGRGFFDIPLHDCQYEGDNVTGNLNCNEPGPTSVRDASRIDRIDLVCLKFKNGEDNENSMGLRFSSIDFSTLHWETSYQAGMWIDGSPLWSYFVDCGHDWDNVVCGVGGVENTINITDKFSENDTEHTYEDHRRAANLIHYDDDYKNLPLVYKWKLR